MEEVKNAEKSNKPKAEKPGAFQQSIISEQIKRRPINKYRLLRKSLITALLAILFGVIASITIWLLEPVLSRWVSKPGETQVRDEVHFIDSGDEVTPQEVLTDYMDQEAFLGADPVDDASLAEIPLTDEQIQALFSRMILDQRDYRLLYQSMSLYAMEMSKSVVTITAITSDTDWTGMMEQQSNQASGLIVASGTLDIYIIADYTPLEGADSFKIRFSNNYTTEGTLRAVDAATGLAMFSVKISHLSADLAADPHVASLGSTFATIGTPVVALGSPMGSAGSIGYGMISASRSTVEYADTADTMLQTDIYGAQNAGGFLFNFTGQVIGVIAPDQDKSDVDGLIWAYGISELKSRIASMANGEPTIYLGIIGTYVTSDANSELGVPFGAYVLRTDMDSPAMLAGIRTGDVIVRLGDTQITNYSDYITALQTYDVGDKITAVVMRKSQQEYVELEYIMTARSSGIIYE